MIRGTTQSFKIDLPCKNTDLEYITIFFSQPNNPNRNLPRIKELHHCGPRNNENELDGTNNISVSLSAWETAQFSDKYKARMQLRAKPKDGVEFAMQEYLITVYPMPDDLINMNPSLPPETSDEFVIFDGDSIVS